MKKILIGNIIQDNCTSMHVYLHDLIKYMKNVDYIEPSTKIKSGIYKIFIYSFKIPR